MLRVWESRCEYSLMNVFLTSSNKAYSAGRTCWMPTVITLDLSWKYKCWSLHSSTIQSYNSWHSTMSDQQSMPLLEDVKYVHSTSTHSEILTRVHSCKLVGWRTCMVPKSGGVCTVLIRLSSPTPWHFTTTADKIKWSNPSTGQVTLVIMVIYLIYALQAMGKEPP